MFEKKYVKCYENHKYKKNNSIRYLYEYDSPSLKILIAVDNTKYKTSIGGCRFINNTPRNKAIDDVWWRKIIYILLTIRKKGNA